MMHKKIKVYLDDIIAKSHTGEDHVANLRKLFERFSKYQLLLNLTKCTFGATFRKLLGFIINEWGIKIDPDKV